MTASSRPHRTPERLQRQHGAPAAASRSASGVGASRTTRSPCTLADRTANGTGVRGSLEVELDPVPAGGPHRPQRHRPGPDPRGQERPGGRGLGARRTVEHGLATRRRRPKPATEITESTSLECASSRAGIQRRTRPSSTWPARTWKVISPALKGELSAVGYYFGRALQETTEVSRSGSSTRPRRPRRSRPGSAERRRRRCTRRCEMSGRALHDHAAGPLGLLQRARWRP